MKKVDTEDEAFMFFVMDNLSTAKVHHANTTLSQLKKELRLLWNASSEHVKDQYQQMVVLEEHSCGAEKKRVLSSGSEEDDACMDTTQSSFMDGKKRKIDHLAGVFYNDILKNILLYLDIPEFAKSRPWLVSKQWNQLFYKKGLKFPKLYVHSYLKLDEEQKTSLRDMLKDSGLNHKYVFEMLFCMNWNFIEEHERLLGNYKQTSSKRTLSTMKKQLKFQKFIVDTGFERVIQNTTFTILKENLFKIIVVNHLQEEETNSEDNLCTFLKKKTSCTAFLSNGFPLEISISHCSSSAEIEFGKHCATKEYESTDLAFDGTTVLTASSSIQQRSFSDDDNVDISKTVELQAWRDTIILETTPPLDSEMYASVVLSWLNKFVDISFPMQENGLYEVKFLGMEDERDNERSVHTESDSEGEQ
ncbi:hypothetical protein C9374_008083 [Naegleria lovaniensis]|uniref:F-box domain-containing protein n=1 Tax=Naegleria lovaniensis TaxID=51637 RepID=A0AA88GFK2_NAELO|nr:uncharacterized protein C9374_008083 [Naegleria lovaniensis]KAG2378444.1 hypothetical protein C9374_008083 [Naegleria lovaniensis]